MQRALELAATKSSHPWHGLPAAALQRRLKSSTDFPSFIDSFMAGYALLDDHSSYQKVTEDLLQRFETEGITCAEVLYSPGVACQRMGVSIQAIHDGIEHALRHSSVQVRFILDTVLNLGPEFMKATLDLVMADRRAFTRGFSIGGGDPNLTMDPFLFLFEEAQQRGLYCVAHVGEVDGSENIRFLLERVDLQRIAHGCRAVNDEGLMKQLAQRGVAIDVCLSSNLATGVVDAIEHHPVLEFIGHKIPFNLSTDDPFYFQTDLFREYCLMAQISSNQDFNRMAKHSLKTFNAISN